MPNYFRLISKETKRTVSLLKIDEELCELLNVPCDPMEYVHRWYDTIGFGLAMGKTFEQLKDIYKGLPNTIKIIEYLEAHYTSDAWAE